MMNTTPRYFELVRLAIISVRHFLCGEIITMRNLQANIAAVVAMLCVGWSSIARADLNERYIITVEWLVDHSDSIVVVRAPTTRSIDADDLTKFTVIEQLKGDKYEKDREVGKLEFSEPRIGQGAFRPKWEGITRLLFIEENELIQSVGLERHNKFDQYPTWEEAVYGVSQYGELLLSSSELFRAVRIRIEEGPGKPLLRFGANANRQGVRAPQTFPLETNGVTYVLAVPITEQRRNHYIEVSRQGNARERMHAITELAAFGDAKSVRAIEELTHVQDVDVWYGSYDTFGAANVRHHARRCLAELGGREDESK